MLNKENLIALAKAAAKATPATAYSFNGENLSAEALNETLRQEFQGLCNNYAAYRENKNLIFSIIEETLDEILPKKVEESYRQFAEVKQFDNNARVLFRRKLTSNNRAKQFITRVGLAARYEVFKLGKNEESFEIRTSAIGGACQVAIEEFVDGRVDFAELTKIIMDGMDELIYKEIAHAMKASINQLPAANKVVANGFDEDAMDRLIQVASAYGVPTIYCTKEFAVRMIPQEAWKYTEAMKAELWRTGRLADYKGTSVVILEQGFEDETNSRKVIDPGYAWIIPTGADNKPVKVAFQGPTFMKDTPSNDDWSQDLHVYKKVGVVAMLGNNICAYCDTALAGQMETWNLNGAKGIMTYDGRQSL